MANNVEIRWILCKVLGDETKGMDERQRKSYAWKLNFQNNNITIY